MSLSCCLKKLFLLSALLRCVNLLLTPVKLLPMKRHTETLLLTPSLSLVDFLPVFTSYWMLRKSAKM
jgi:hypothetical protein